MEIMSIWFASTSPVCARHITGTKEMFVKRVRKLMKNWSLGHRPWKLWVTLDDWMVPDLSQILTKQPTGQRNKYPFAYPLL